MNWPSVMLDNCCDIHGSFKIKKEYQAYHRSLAIAARCMDQSYVVHA
jgi:hypothetical protein